MGDILMYIWRGICIEWVLILVTIIYLYIKGLILWTILSCLSTANIDFLLPYRNNWTFWLLCHSFIRHVFGCYVPVIYHRYTNILTAAWFAEVKLSPSLQSMLYIYLQHGWALNYMASCIHVPAARYKLEILLLLQSYIFV